MGRISTSVDDIYLTMCKDLLKAPKVGNTRELNNVKLVLKNIDNNIVSVRGLSPSYLAGELLWYFNGDNSLKFINNFSKFWNGISDDGETCNSAYGHLMQVKYGFNQIKKVIEILETDPLSRRAKINLNVPNPNVKETKDEPCTMSLHFMIRKNKLDCTVVMRSNDIWFGFPYDVAFFTTLQKYIAKRLGVGYGWYTHFAVSLHMYDRDAETIAGIVENPISKRVAFNENAFMAHFKEIFEKLKKSDDVRGDSMKLLNEFGIYKEDKT